MKLLVFFLMMATANVSNTDFSNHYVYQLTQDQKRQIDPEELPETVTAALEESEYADWTMGKVYLLENGEVKSFEIHLLQGDERVVLLADDKGNLQVKTDT